MPIQRSKLLEAVNDAVEKFVDTYNEENDCEVMLTVERGLLPEPLAEAVETDELTVDGGDAHGVFVVSVQAD